LQKKGRYDWRGERKNVKRSVEGSGEKRRKRKSKDDGMKLLLEKKRKGKPGKHFKGRKKEKKWRGDKLSSMKLRGRREKRNARWKSAWNGKEKKGWKTQEEIGKTGVGEDLMKVHGELRTEMMVNVMEEEMLAIDLAVLGDLVEAVGGKGRRLRRMNGAVEVAGKMMIEDEMMIHVVMVVEGGEERKLLHLGEVLPEGDLLQDVGGLQCDGGLHLGEVLLQDVDLLKDVDLLLGVILEATLGALGDLGPQGMDQEIEMDLRIEMGQEIVILEEKTGVVAGASVRDVVLQGGISEEMTIGDLPVVLLREMEEDLGPGGEVVDLPAGLLHFVGLLHLAGDRHLVEVRLPAEVRLPEGKVDLPQDVTTDREEMMAPPIGDVINQLLAVMVLVMFQPSLEPPRKVRMTAGPLWPNVDSII